MQHSDQIVDHKRFGDAVGESVLHSNCEITTEQKIPRTSRDKDDDHILAAALKTDVDCIITGDNDLLVLKVIEEIPILLPADFWKLEQIND